MTASERMNELLKEKGKTVRELASYLGLDYGTVRLWKYKQTIPTAEHLVAISEFLGVSVKYLLTGLPELYTEDLPEIVKEEIKYFHNLSELRQHEVLWYTKNLALEDQVG